MGFSADLVDIDVDTVVLAAVAVMLTLVFLPGKQNILISWVPRFHHNPLSFPTFA